MKISDNHSHNRVTKKQEIPPSADRIKEPEDNVQITDGVKTYVTGNREDIKSKTTGGLCIMGGGPESDGAMKWMIDKSGGGDFVILRTDDSDGYNDYLYKELGGVNSVRTLIVDSREKADSPYVEEVIRNAEALFIAGGDQWEYYKYWNGTRVEDAINHLTHEKKVPVGGTSAGCHSMGSHFYSAENGGVDPEEALSDPYNEYMTFKSDFLQIPFMKYIITDTHFHARDRMGRSAGFLARNIEDNYQDRFNNFLLIKCKFSQEFSEKFIN